MKYNPLSRSPKGRTIWIMMALALFCLCAMSSCGNSTVRVYDHAHVLDVARIKGTTHLSYPLDIYTTSTFTGTKSTFRKTAIDKLGSDPNKVVVAIDTANHYIYIAKGSSVSLSPEDINRAITSFSNNFGGANYTNATVASLNTLGKTSNTPNVGSIFSFTPGMLCCAAPLLMVLAVGLFAISRRRSSGGRNWGQPGGPPPDYPYDNAGFQNQRGYDPDNRGGVNPLAAGGLGAAAGGLLGYILGKRQGEERREDQGNSGNGGNFGGGGDFGNGGDSGSGGNFGRDDDSRGGGDDFGRGGNFGGGDDFGRGGNFGNDDDSHGGGGNF